MRVLVATTCTPDDHKTLCAVRSLALSGAHVTVGGNRFLGEAFYSRFCDRRIEYPHPAKDIDGFIHCLLQHLADNQYDVLLPMTDYVAMAVALHHDKLNAYVRVPVPCYDTLLKTRDKLHTIEIARQIGIETPTTYCVRERQDLEAIARSIDYPCVLKLRQGVGAIGLKFAGSAAELMQSYDNLPSASDMVFDYTAPLIQEYVPGEVHDVCVLFNRGQLRAALTQRRLKMYPSRGGGGILNETTDEPELRDQAVRLLEALQWHGPAQVEFKVDSRDGVPKLMEVNGRFWGSLALPVQAGVNFPLLVCRMAVDGDVDPVLEYRVGLRYRAWFPIVLLYAVEARGGWRSLWEFFRPEHDTVSDVWFSDPVPTLAEVFYICRRIWSRRLQLRDSQRLPDIINGYL
jgi:predicted ATP-grasp superfamily ATP-dependent carboligase